MTVGYRSRVSRAQNDLYMQDLDGLYESLPELERRVHAQRPVGI